VTHVGFFLFGFDPLFEAYKYILEPEFSRIQIEPGLRSGASYSLDVK
jgi:hypothetical protein